MNLDELERQLGIARNVPRAPTRADIDARRRKMLSKPWRGIRARRKR
jgi:hypothetical protein